MHHAVRILAFVEGHGGKSADEGVRELLAGLNPGETLAALHTGTASLGGEALGNFAVAALPPAGDAPLELLEAIAASVIDRGVRPQFRIALMDYLSAAVRRGAPSDGHSSALAVARSVDEPVSVRARAIRGVRDHPDAESQGLLAELIEGAVDPLADSAAFVTADLAFRGEALTPELEAAVVARASLRLAGTLRALSALRTRPAARAALHRLAREAREPLELVRLLIAAGTALDDDDVTSAVERAEQAGDPAAGAAVAVLREARPSLAAPVRSEPSSTVSFPGGATLSVGELHAAVADVGGG